MYCYDLIFYTADSYLIGLSCANPNWCYFFRLFKHKKCQNRFSIFKKVALLVKFFFPWEKISLKKFKNTFTARSYNKKRDQLEY